MCHLELPRIDFLLFSFITGKYPALAQTFEVYGYLCEIRLILSLELGEVLTLFLVTIEVLYICQIILAKATRNNQKI